jgi:hypothetical protein
MARECPCRQSEIARRQSHVLSEEIVDLVGEFVIVASELRARASQSREYWWMTPHLTHALAEADAIVHRMAQ